MLDEYRSGCDGWQDSDLPGFLESLAAWVHDSPGYWANRGRPEPEQPDWPWVALALRAAKVDTDRPRCAVAIETKQILDLRNPMVALG